MDKRTHKRHFNILNFILDEYYKLYKKVISYVEKKNINAIIIGLEYNISILDKVSHSQLKILREQEKMLIETLNEYRELNNKLTNKRILNYIKSLKNQ